MFVGRMHQRGVRRAGAIVEQGVDIALGHAALEPVGELGHARIGVFRTRAEIGHAQIVRDLPGTDDHHAVIAQLAQCAADTEMMRGVEMRLYR
jgi:hypothetical protein